MALLNLILVPFLIALGLWEGEGGGDAGAAGDPPADSSKKPDAKPEPAKPDAGRAGGEDALRADLAKERDKRQGLEAELGELRPLKQRLEQLEAANQTETEKAINAAKKEATTAERARWEGVIRAARVETALSAAGCTDPSVAALARDFSGLKVNDNGDVENLTETVQAFKDAHPTLFTARVPGGQIDQGVQPDSDKPRTYEEAVTAYYTSRPGAS